MFKNLAATKFAVSTVLAALTYVGMTRLKQYYTEQKIRKNLIKEYNESKKAKQEENNNANKPAFKGIGKVVEEFAFSPVKNMYIMDGFITTERLTDSRSSQEFIGYAIKEGSCLFSYTMQVKKFRNLWKRMQNQNTANR